MKNFDSALGWRSREQHGNDKLAVNDEEGTQNTLSCVRHLIIHFFQTKYL
jgi:hypothetical protein